MVAFDLTTTLAACLVAGISSVPLEQPEFPAAYTVVGYILMPSLELREPFTAHFDSNSAISRIDYHDGGAKTFQLEKKHFSVVWSPNETTHLPEENCFFLRSEGQNPQGAFPDLTEFEFVRVETCITDPASSQTNIKGENDCLRYERRHGNDAETAGDVFWFVRDADDNIVPVRYVTTRRAHTEIVYLDYNPGPLSGDLFKLESVTEGRCSELRSEAGLDSCHLVNPMKEFVAHDYTHVDEQFSNFKIERNKVYANEAEERERRHNFHQNMRFVNSMNRKNLSYALKLNDRADWSQNEFRSPAGCRLPKVEDESLIESVEGDTSNLINLPESIDWRDKGVVTPVKYQGSCGSCWAFAVVGQIESQYAIQHKKLVPMSEQELLDCSREYGNRGCDGGWPSYAFDYIKVNGLAAESQYGPYREEEGKCMRVRNREKPVKTIKGYRTGSGEQRLLRSLAEYGPVAITLNGEAGMSWVFYSRGVYEDSKCTSKINHAALAVGYGIADRIPFWLIKNSYSTEFADEGYIRISRRNNVCGVTTEPYTEAYL